MAARVMYDEWMEVAWEVAAWVVAVLETAVEPAPAVDEGPIATTVVVTSSIDENEVQPQPDPQAEEEKATRVAVVELHAIEARNEKQLEFILPKKGAGVPSLQRRRGPPGMAVILHCSEVSLPKVETHSYNEVSHRRVPNRDDKEPCSEAPQ